MIFSIGGFSLEGKGWGSINDQEWKIWALNFPKWGSTYRQLESARVQGLEDDLAGHGEASKVGIQLGDAGHDSSLNITQPPQQMEDFVKH